MYVSVASKALGGRIQILSWNQRNSVFGKKDFLCQRTRACNVWRSANDIFDRGLPSVIVVQLMGRYEAESFVGAPKPHRRPIVRRKGPKHCQKKRGRHVVSDCRNFQSWLSVSAGAGSSVSPLSGGDGPYDKQPSTTPNALGLMTTRGMLDSFSDSSQQILRNPFLSTRRHRWTRRTRQSCSVVDSSRTFPPSLGPLSVVYRPVRGFLETPLPNLEILARTVPHGTCRAHARKQVRHGDLVLI